MALFSEYGTSALLILGYYSGFIGFVVGIGLADAATAPLLPRQLLSLIIIGTHQTIIFVVVA